MLLNKKLLQIPRSQEIILNTKAKKTSHPSLRLALYRKPHTKNTLAKFPEARLTFEGHLRIITNKVNGTIGLLRKLQKKKNLLK